MTISLDDAKLHLRVDDTAEDTLIQTLVDAAHESVQNFLKRPVPWDDESGNPVDVPASVKAAELLIVGDLYENREAQFVAVSRTDNPTVARLLWPYRQLEVQ